MVSACGDSARGPYVRNWAQSGRRRLSQHLDLQPFHLHSPPRLIGGEGRALQLPCLREARPIAERQPEAGGRRPQPA